MSHISEGWESQDWSQPLEEGKIFLSAVPSCTFTPVMGMSIMIQQRHGRLPLRSCREGSVDDGLSQFHFFRLHREESQLNFSIGGPFEPAADKLSGTLE